jgi:hypothetical protein
MIYRWLGFLGSNILSSLHLPPSLVSISFIHDTQDDNLKTGGRGRGEMSKDQIIRQQVGLAIYKSFNMLWIRFTGEFFFVSSHNIFAKFLYSISQCAGYMTIMSKSCRRYDLHNHINKFPITISFYWARICKRLWSPGIDYKLSNPLAYKAWSAGTTNRIVVLARHDENRFLAAYKCLQIRALGINKIQFLVLFLLNRKNRYNDKYRITRIYMIFWIFTVIFVCWIAAEQTPCLW